MIHMRNFNEFEVRNITFLTQKNIEYTLVQITETGFKKVFWMRQSQCVNTSRTVECTIIPPNCKGKIIRCYNQLRF